MQLQCFCPVLMCTHIVKAFVKDDVPLPNGLQPLDNVGAPKSRVPSREKKGSKMNPQSLKVEATLFCQQLCESSFKILLSSPTLKLSMLGVCSCDPGHTRACRHPPVASLEGSSSLLRHLPLAQNLQFCHVCASLLSQASLPYSR